MRSLSQQPLRGWHCSGPKAWKEEDAKEATDSVPAQKNSQFCWGGGTSALYKILIVDFKKYLSIYLFISVVPGLSCGMRDLYLWHADFLVVACMRDLVP